MSQQCGYCGAPLRGGLSPVEHVGADGVARLAAADVVGGVVQPYYPPEL